MRLNDFGTTVVVLALLYGAHYIAKEQVPGYNEKYQAYKTTATELFDEYRDAPCHLRDCAWEKEAFDAK